MAGDAAVPVRGAAAGAGRDRAPPRRSPAQQMALTAHAPAARRNASLSGRRRRRRRPEGPRPTERPRRRLGGRRADLLVPPPGAERHGCWQPYPDERLSARRTRSASRLSQALPTGWFVGLSEPHSSAMALLAAVAGLAGAGARSVASREAAAIRGEFLPAALRPFLPGKGNKPGTPTRVQKTGGGLRPPPVWQRRRLKSGAEAGRSFSLRNQADRVTSIPRPEQPHFN